MLFFRQNWISISLVVVALFLILSIVAIKNIKFRDNSQTIVDKIVLFEKFQNREGFCDGKEDPEKKNDKCAQFQEKKCLNTDCCIWAKEKNRLPRCMLGYDRGAKIDADKKDLEWWWYKASGQSEAQCYPEGQKCKETSKKEAVNTTIPQEDVKVVKTVPLEGEVEDVEQSISQKTLALKQKHDRERLEFDQKQVREKRAVEEELKALTLENAKDKASIEAKKAVEGVAIEEELKPKKNPVVYQGPRAGLGEIQNLVNQGSLKDIMNKAKGAEILKQIKDNKQNFLTKGFSKLLGA
uniref:Uncharacterized protein n=1 Tax=uncultured marine group II/III euryarchaeote AD1000_88_G11 TaxID=1457822 RepID=A0A075G5F9_9EURY|nr:hypothetical protein [uncultured marine group II/III euryarchaeote AD1000_88_G11]